MVLDHARGGGEGEQIVDRGRDLEGTLVAVAHHAAQPFRVGGAPAHDAADLLLERAHARVLGAGMVVVEDLRLAAGQVAHGGGEAALELVVVVAVEQVVLAIVLVVQDQLDAGAGAARAQAGRRGRRCRGHRRGRPRRARRGRDRPRRASRARRSAPAGRHRRRRACCRRCERRRAAGRPRRARPAASSRAASAACRRRQRVVALRLVQAGHRAAGVVEQLDLGREGVAEEAGDAQGHVDARPAEHARAAAPRRR